MIKVHPLVHPVDEETGCPKIHDLISSMRRKQLIKLNSKEKEEKIALFKKAWDLCELEHKGQTRTEINPYTNQAYPFEMHPKQTASILINVGADMETITHSLIHDIGDNSGKNYDKKITEEFGEVVGKLYKINTSIIRTKNPVKRQKRKHELFLKSKKEYETEPRALIAKVADRLQNMLSFYTYNYMQQKRIYNETKKLVPLIKEVNEELYKALVRELEKNIIPDK